MKIVCTQENLKAGLSVVGRIISSNNTLPILSNLLIKTENGQLKISSTNLEVAITTQVRCKVEEDGEITVVGKTISELVNNLPNKNIILESSGSDLKIDTENYHTSIKTLPAEEFPLIPNVENGKVVSLDSQDLKTSLDQVVFAASTNQTQPEISGVLFGYNESGLVVAATDRYRLAEKKLQAKEKQNGEHQAIIPQKTLLELSRIIGGQKGLVEMLFNETQVCLRFNDTQIISRLIDGHYPDYKQIIPAEFKTTVVTEKQGLVNALRTVAVFSQSSNSAKFSFSQSRQTLVLAAESSELGKSEVELPAKIEGLDVEVVLNHHYVLDSLASINSANVIMKIIDDNSPSLILPEGTNDYIYLVMPIKS
jgi:DNA polymerase-3 subunit beta